MCTWEDTHAPLYKRAILDDVMCQNELKSQQSNWSAVKGGVQCSKMCFYCTQTNVMSRGPKNQLHTTNFVMMSVKVSYSDVFYIDVCYSDPLCFHRMQPSRILTTRRPGSITSGFSWAVNPWSQTPSPSLWNLKEKKLGCLLRFRVPLMLIKRAIFLWKDRRWSLMNAGNYISYFFLSCKLSCKF